MAVDRMETVSEVRRHRRRCLTDEDIASAVIVYRQEVHENLLMLVSADKEAPGRVEMSQATFYRLMRGLGLTGRGGRKLNFVMNSLEEDPSLLGVKRDVLANRLGVSPATVQRAIARL